MENKVTRSELKREVILRAATDIFMEKGFKATSVDMVSQEAGVSKKRFTTILVIKRGYSVVC